MMLANALFSQIESSLYLSVFADSSDGVVDSAVTEWVVMFRRLRIRFVRNQLIYSQGRNDYCMLKDG
jgi:hypothetical protein